jgi:divalent metal cation (Fe/Co/Zn/Cd) transporter
LLSTESKAAVVDGVISAGAGGGLLAATLLGETPLGFLVPVADSIIVLVLSAVIVRQPLMMFLRALKQVAGAAADSDSVEKVRQCVSEVLQDRPFSLLEVAVTKMGRAHIVITYVKPDDSVDGETADKLWAELDAALCDTLGQAKTEIIIAGQPPYKE